MNKARFEAFTDGVFAFAITLLSLSIAVPVFRHTPPSETELTRSLLALWPRYLCYLMSFAVIGIMWQNHHALFRLVERIDRWTVFLNLLLLSVTVFVPFATETLAKFLPMRPSTFLYGVTLTSAAIAFNAILAHLIRGRSFRPDVSNATIRQTVIAYRVGLATYVVATLTALVVPLLSFVLYLSIAAYYLVPRGVDRDLTLRT
jgi:TMEM175 potassium channel family protein